MKTVVPYNHKKAGKKEQVREMFDNIASSYDFLNNFFSLNIDRLWRKKALKILSQNKEIKPEIILDVACGTGDFALSCLKKMSDSKIFGLDISPKMLDIAKQKIIKYGLKNKFETTVGDAENIPFPKNTFDAVTVAFGVRNFENLETGIKEIHRVLKKNGSVLILEFSKPSNTLIKKLYSFYLTKYIPIVGRWISKDISAYGYLARSVEAFPYGKEFCGILAKNNFSKVSYYSLSFGICTVYFAKK